MENNYVVSRALVGFFGLFNVVLFDVEIWLNELDLQSSTLDVFCRKQGGLKLKLIFL